MTVSRDGSKSFLTLDWQDVYTSNLTHSYILFANAVRSIHSNPAVHGNTTKILVISPDVEAVKFLGLQLQTLANNLSMKLSLLTGENDLGELLLPHFLQLEPNSS